MRLNRILPTLALIILAAGFPAKAAVLTLLSPPSVSIGDSVEIDLSIGLDPGESLYAYQVDVRFPLFLRADSVTELGYFATNSVGATPSIDNTGGVVSVFSSLSGSDLLASSDSLFRISFTALSAGSGFVEVDPSTLILLDADFADVAVSAFNPAGIKASDAPEPATMIGAAAGLAALLLARSRRGSQLLFQPAARE